MITVRSTINLAHQSVPEVIPAVQGDTGRSILFSLADFTIPAGATARYFITKPSGLAVYNDATIDGNTVLVDLTAQSIAEYGDCPGQVRIMLGQTVVTSFEFILHVEPFRGIDAVESTTETNIFDKAVEDAREAIAEAAEEAEEYISQALDTTLTIPDKAADAKATGDAISDSADAVIAQMRAEIANVYPTETAQGNPATFDDGADNIPVKDLKVSIVPTQDLHGYDKPWAGGAGKNLCEQTVASIKALNTDGTWNDNAYTWRGITYTILTDSANNVIGYDVDGTATARGWLLISDTDFGSVDANYNNSLVQGYVFTSDCPLYDISHYLCFYNSSSKKSYILVDGMTANHDKWYPMVRLSSVSDATFEPYSNECPITGMTEVEVERTGKNLYQMRTTSQTQNGVTATANSDGTIALSGTATGGNALISLIENSEEISALFNKGGTFSLSFSEGTYNSNTLNVSIEYKDASGGSSKYLTPGNPVTIPQGGVFVKSVLWMPQGNTVQTLSHFAIQLEFGSSASAFKPYHSIQTVTTDLGRTVYSGVLDVMSGVLTVDMASVDLGSLTWVKFDGSEYGTMYYTDSLVGSIAYDDWDKIYGISSAYKGYPNRYNQPIGSEWSMPDGGFRVRNTDGRVYVRDENAPTLSAFTTRVNGVQLVYELATPQTYTFTPQELLSVLGTNHISTDAESVEVVYRQDIGLVLKRMSDSLLPYLPLTRDGIYDLKAEVTGGEKSLYWWTQAISMISSARPMQTPIADESVEEPEEEPMDDIEENEEE